MKPNSLTKDLFIKNRSKLLGRLPLSSLCILFSNDEMPRNGDQFFPYRQSSDFFYLTGISQEKSILVLAPGYPEKQMTEILFILKSTPLMETWTGHKLSPEEASGISGIKNIKYLESFDGMLDSLMQFFRTVYLNIPEIPKFSPEIETREHRMSARIRNSFPLHQYERLAPWMKELRVIKEKEEIDAIRKACNITSQAFDRVIKKIKPGISEKEVEAEISYEFIKNGAVHAYQPILGSGANALVLHYVENNSILCDGDLILMDFGAEYENYASDCTRTIPVSGKFNKRQAEIYDGLHKIFREAISMMVPGTNMEEVHKKLCEKMKQFHIRLGLYTREESDKAGTESPLWFKYYMHGTGHSLGLDVHDVYDKKAEFKPGMVFTCEPAIYIPEEKTGIRIENDILITSDGNIDLMAGIPSDRKSIEKLMSE